MGGGTQWLGKEIDNICSDLGDNDAWAYHDGAGSKAAELQISWPAGSLPEPDVESYLQEAW